MKDCRKKKRLQIYLDGWMDGRESRQFEKHLRECGSCQNELIELEEISSAALEIVDQAPERDYWESFFARVHNRIGSRGVSPYQIKKSSVLNLKLLSYAAGFMALAAVLILILSRMPGTPEKTVAIRQPVMVNPVPEESMIETSSADQSQKPGIVTEERSSNLHDPENDPVTTVNTAGPEEISFSQSPGIIDEVTGPLEEDYQTVFRDNLRKTSAGLSLNEDDNNVNRLLEAYGRLAGSDFSVNPNVVAEGILSGRSFSAKRSAAGLPNAGIPGSGEAINPGWGYLGLPGDTTRTDDYRRYIIELDLMLVK